MQFMRLTQSPHVAVGDFPIGIDQLRRWLLDLPKYAKTYWYGMSFLLLFFSA